MSLEEMSPARLIEIIDEDSKPRINIDRYGGLFVLWTDTRDYGKQAIIQRRELLRFIVKSHESQQQRPRTLGDISSVIYGLKLNGLTPRAIAESLKIDVHHVVRVLANA